MQRSASGIRRRWLSSGALACVAGVISLLLAIAWVGLPSRAAATSGDGVPGEEDFIAFRGAATAAGMRMTVSTPGALTTTGDDIVDAGVPVVQSLVANGGVSTAFASAPYPGEVIVRAPDLAAAAGAPARPPDYPAFVEARQPDRSEEAIENPGMSLHATAAPEAARATGRVGAPELPSLRVASMTSTTSVEKTVGKIIVAAESVVRGIEVADVMTLGSVTSKIVATKQLGVPAPAFEESVTIKGATVGGQSVTITGEGLILADEKVGPPADVTKAVESQLAAQGVAVRVVDAPSLTDGKTARALQILINRPLGIPDQSGAVTGKVVVTLASVTAQVSATDATDPLPADSYSSASPEGSDGVASRMGTSSDVAPASEHSGSEQSASGLGGYDSQMAVQDASDELLSLPSAATGSSGPAEPYNPQPGLDGDPSGPLETLPNRAGDTAMVAGRNSSAENRQAELLARQIALTRAADRPFVLLIAAAGLILAGAAAWRRSLI